MSPALPALRYLGAADVRAAMPPVEERLRLAELTMTALVADAELPPKVAVHPRPPESFAHAMPAFLRAGDGSGAGDGLGMKWVTGFPDNVETGLPAIHAVVLLNDAATGIPIAVMDGGPITAERTAAVTGVAIRHFGPRPDGRPATVGLIGAGVQGHSHVPVIGHLLPGCRLRVFDRDAARAARLAAEASATDGIVAAEAVAEARDATADADVVVTAAAFGPVRQVMTNDWLASGALVVPVDYATYAAAEVARDASLFLVDERAQFLANREAGLFEGYPDPDATIGEAIRSGTGRPDGRVVVTHLGVGLADVIFGRAILATAIARDIGTDLPR